MKISNVSEMRNLDKGAIENYGIVDDLLMENAGNAAYFIILNKIGLKGKRFIVFAGSGNNGGDGLVATRKIFSSGGEVKVYLMSDPAKYKGNAQKNYNIASKMGIDIQSIKDTRIDEIKRDIERADLIIDAILGTGLEREVTGSYAEIINLINNSDKKVLSIDIPSGISGDTGRIMGTAVKADYTVTYGLPKIGNILYPGYELCGELYVSHISFPPQHYDTDEIKLETNDPLALPKRAREGHKGSFGDVLFIAGAQGYYGAPYFSSLSFLKAGGGYSRLATAKSIIPFIGSKGSEIVFTPLAETIDGSISKKSKEKLLQIIEKVDMVVVGPGLSLNEETQGLVREITMLVEKPILIDGDGLTAISEDLQIKKRSHPTILTPHPGEMSRLTGKSVREILENKIEVLREITSDLGAIVVLKGAHSLIGYPDEKIYVNMSGNPGMASAGSGDVLTGTIAAMYGIGFDISTSVRMGVFVHGFAGDLARKEKGEDGITAQDILDYLPYAMKLLRENFEGVKSMYEIKVV